MTLLLPGHTGGHTLSSEDLSPFLEGGCCFAGSIYIMAEDSPWIFFWLRQMARMDFTSLKTLLPTVGLIL